MPDAIALAAYLLAAAYSLAVGVLLAEVAYKIFTRGPPTEGGGL